MSADDADSDSALAQAAAAGSDQAFSRLVSRHKESLYQLLRRHTGNGDEAYEALQEAFIAAWRALNRYDGQRPFNVWLRTIALNKARDRNRRRLVRRIILGTSALDSPEALSTPDPTTDVEGEALAREQTARLDAELSRLPNHLKEPLLLVAFDGASHSEAADILGVSSKAIEMRLYRARKLLAARLDADLRPDG
ncbi:MAG: RNA polymerase sigma factor [Pseudomonadota bacterium]